MGPRPKLRAVLFDAGNTLLEGARQVGMGAVLFGH